PWKIVFFHHPPYSSSERDPNYLVIDNLLPILEEGGVDLVLSGHDHHTERTKPIWEGKVAEDDPRSLTYIVAGAGGAGLREATGDWWTDMVNFKKHAFVSLTVDGCTLTGKAISSEGETVDTFSLYGCD
ncbi:MAG: 3',5'-cyclic AMP phosphodiesterase CpdA, partial [Myxococcota bacterium]